MKRSLIADYLDFLAGGMSASRRRALERRLVADGSSIEQFGEKLLGMLDSIVGVTSSAETASHEFLAGGISASRRRALERRMVADGSSIEHFGENLLGMLDSIVGDISNAETADRGLPASISRHEEELAKFRASLLKSYSLWRSTITLQGGHDNADPMRAATSKREAAVVEGRLIAARLREQGPGDERDEHQITEIVGLLRASTREGGELVEAYAEALYLAGQPDHAVSLLNKWVAAIVNERGPFSSSQAPLKRKLASILARTEQLEKAVHVLEETRSFLQVEREPTDSELQQTILELASLAHLAGTLDTAEQAAQLLEATLQVAAAPAIHLADVRVRLACIAHDRAVLLDREGPSPGGSSRQSERAQYIGSAIDRLDTVLTFTPRDEAQFTLGGRARMCQAAVLRLMGRRRDASDRFVLASGLCRKLATPSVEAVWIAIEESRSLREFANDLPTFERAVSMMEEIDKTVDTFPDAPLGLRAFANHVASALDVDRSQFDRAEDRSRRASAPSTSIEVHAPFLAFAFIIRHGDVLAFMSRFKEARDEYSRAETLLRERQLLTEPYFQRVLGCVAASWGAEGQAEQARQLVAQLQQRASTSGIVEPDVFSRLLGFGPGLQSAEMPTTGPLRTTTKVTVGRAVRSAPLYCDWAQPTFAELRRLGVLTW